MDEKLTETELKVLDIIETSWLYYEVYPSDEHIRNALAAWKDGAVWRPVASYAKTKFRTALFNRGVPEPPVEDKFIARLTDVEYSGFQPAQIAAACMLTDYIDGRGDIIKLREIGVSTQQFNAWMRDPRYKKFFNTLSKKNYSNAQHIARKGVIKGMDRGDINAIKYFNEQTGESPENRNIQVLLSRLVEAIQLHVKDPKVMYQIEQSFGRIMSGQNAIEAEVVSQIES